MVDGLKRLVEHIRNAHSKLVNAVFGYINAQNHTKHTDTPFNGGHWTNEDECYIQYTMFCIESYNSWSESYNKIGPTTEHKIKTLIHFYSIIINHGFWKCLSVEIGLLVFSLNVVSLRWHIKENLTDLFRVNS